MTRTIAISNRSMLLAQALAAAAATEAPAVSDAKTFNLSDRVVELRRDRATERHSHMKPWRRRIPKVGRNDPCPCESGAKFKRCHGARK